MSYDHSRSKEDASLDETVPTEEVEVTVRLHVKIKAAKFDCEGRERADLIGDLMSAIEDTVLYEMPYEPHSLEDTDLVQEILEVDISRIV